MGVERGYVTDILSSIDHPIRRSVNKGCFCPKVIRMTMRPSNGITPLEAPLFGANKKNST